MHPQDAMLEAMLTGWRAQQSSRGLREITMARREQLVRRFVAPYQRVPVGTGAPRIVG
ncbi:hypothetical protein HBB16_19420 [Pseudonocardia sp. MCCB 268]|nr:hypothetical protein [Pseudonocardia cytotoxica]